METMTENEREIEERFESDYYQGTERREMPDYALRALMKYTDYVVKYRPETLLKHDEVWDSLYKEFGWK